ncbi:uncharacterized protein BO96DRAFT_348119 [Aspergillus niger CBS 101883]|uniref:Uncharacterized protein n=2 Tax=Aspergillus niger TaxID=5061 RepID=A2QJT2_ASPNC|nr:uncharacterized protein BO96DRAFT_348119 [Aspergillus niger CBS 101883]XP_059603680.1 hypothetical protein An04g08170 [Aspergillus niger]PYH52168.1 hypothetical protein BO96DRAFT_348119 [Aspergillus niger CBS 101883]CAK44783.1 hypothetical protein An04g08170 [Aspergillus niger]
MPRGSSCSRTVLRLAGVLLNPSISEQLWPSSVVILGGYGMDRSMDGCSEAVSMEPPCIGPVPDLGIQVGFSWNDNSKQVIYIVACGAEDKLGSLTNRSVGEYLGWLHFGMLGVHKEDGEDISGG